MLIDLTQLLDAGWTVTIFRNQLGTYTAIATKGEESPQDADDWTRTTDDFTPEKVIRRLKHKLFVECRPNPLDYDTPEISDD